MKLLNLFPVLAVALMATSCGHKVQTLTAHPDRDDITVIQANNAYNNLQGKGIHQPPLTAQRNLGLDGDMVISFWFEDDYRNPWVLALGVPCSYDELKEGSQLPVSSQLFLPQSKLGDRAVAADRYSGYIDIAHKDDTGITLRFTDYSFDQEAPGYGVLTVNGLVFIPAPQTDEAEDVPCMCDPDEYLPEEILNQDKLTELIIVEDDNVKSSKEAQQTEAASSFDNGTEDLHVVGTPREEVVEHPAPAANHDGVFESVEERPEFPGGEAALMRYLGNHITYPAAAWENDIQGRVMIRFVVRKDGSVGDVQVVRSVDPDLDNEAVRVVKSLPNFIPGKMNGHPVNVWYHLPITFRLQS